MLIYIGKNPCIILQLYDSLIDINDNVDTRGVCSRGDQVMN